MHCSIDFVWLPLGKIMCQHVFAVVEANVIIMTYVCLPNIHEYISCKGDPEEMIRGDIKSYQPYD